MAIEFCESGLRVGDGNVLPVYSGEMHYWRQDRSSWRACLQEMKRLGFTVVSTSVPWSVHERAEGEFDFQGNLDLGAFLDAAHEVGLVAFVRAGPCVGGEVTRFGFPLRVLQQSDALAVSSHGTPVWMPAPPMMFPMPSCASGVFQEEVTCWLEAVARVLTPRIHGAGAVVALQVDNELPGFWRSDAFSSDYHPDALAWWQDYSEGEQAPRKYSPNDMERCLRWLKFREEYQCRWLRWLSGAIDTVGLGALARYHGTPTNSMHLANLPSAAESVDGVAGMAFQHRWDELGVSIRRRAAYVAGSSLLPMASDVAVGGPPWRPPVSSAAEQHGVLSILAGGIRAFNLYMAVERDRWHGGVVTQDGRVGESSEWIEALLAGLHEVDFHNLGNTAPIAVIVSRAETRAAIASCSLSGAPPSVTELLGLGPAGHAELALDESARAYPRWLAAVLDALELAEVPYRLIDEDCLQTIGTETKAIIMPSLRRVDGGAWAALHALSHAGIRIIVGPKLPEEDELGRPLAGDATQPPGSGLLAQESLEDIAGLADDLLGLAGDLSDLWITPESPDVHCSVLWDKDSQVRVLFTCSRSDDEQIALVNVPLGTTIRDVLAGEALAEQEGRLSVALGPNQVRLFLVDPV